MLSHDLVLLFPVGPNLVCASHIKFQMATIHKLTQLVLSKDYSKCFWSNTKFWGELQKLGVNPIKVGANLVGQICHGAKLVSCGKSP